ncbi:MAG: histidinol dehydrogenase [Verrucomicrobiae bacterium]|nr:histidinol dehydrogenase [Verrucomicrobiae bacterium]
MRLISHKDKDYADWRQAMGRKATPSASVADAVAHIVLRVRAEGDQALRDFTRQFDGVELDEIRLSSPPPKPPKGVAAALADARDNIARFARAQLPRDWRQRNRHGASVGEVFRPFDRVGAYVPGGSAPLVSTALMTVTLAKVAGCRQIAVVTPPPVDPVLHYAIRLAGATEIYQIGGAHAIAALAFGTASVPAVQKIVGPGNRYVIEAKRQVVGAVAIDQLPGPSEAMVIADAHANPAFVASDLLAQSEHGPDSAGILLTTSLPLRDAVRAQIQRQIAGLSRRPILERSLAAGCSLAHVRTLAEAAGIANDYAPEHLSLQIRRPASLLPRIRHAGAIFVGAFSPIVAGDFVAGPSHTLPTGGAAKSFAGLTAGEFFRRTSIIEYAAPSLRRALPSIATFASIEGLDAHGRSAAIRFER